MIIIIFLVNICTLLVCICRHQPDPIHQCRPQQQDYSCSSSTAPLCQDQNHLHQELTIKENTIRQKDTQLKQKDAQLREQDAKLRQLIDQLQEKDAALQHKDQQYAVLLHEHKQLQQKHDQLCRERDQLQQESSRSLSAKPVSCSHLFISFSSIKPYIITRYSFPSLNGLSYIVPPFYQGHCDIATGWWNCNTFSTNYITLSLTCTAHSSCVPLCTRHIIIKETKLHVSPCH